MMLKALVEKALSFALLLVVLPTLVCILDGVVVGLNQIFEWLRTGVWVPHTAAEGLARLGVSPPHVDWVIPQRVINWVLDGPRMFWMPVFGFVYAGVVLTLLIWALAVADRELQKWRERRSARW